MGSNEDQRPGFKKVLLLLGTLLLVSLGLARISFDREVLNLLPQHLPVVQGLKIYQTNFANADEIVLTLTGLDPALVDQEVQRLAQVLRAQSNQVASVQAEPPWNQSPADLAELAAFQWLNQPPAIVQELAARLTPERIPETLAASLDELQSGLSPQGLAMLGHDPYGLFKLPSTALGNDGAGYFSSADGLFRLLTLQPAVSLSGYRECRDYIHWLRTVCQPSHASLSLRLTGRPAFAAEIGGGMERDMSGSITGTLLVIAILFWLTHRNLFGLALLSASLLLILGFTLAAGGLILGQLNLISIGFAAILAGLAEDFGVVIYEESRAHPGASADSLRTLVSRGVWASAITTAGAFGILNFSVLPGLRQLGSLVALGVLIAAVVMLYLYLPVLARRRVSASTPIDSARGLFSSKRVLSSRLVLFLTMVLIIASAGSLGFYGMQFDAAPNVFHPKHSEAHEALAQMQANLGASNEALLALIQAENASLAVQRLDSLESHLLDQQRLGRVHEWLVPTAFWIHPANQQTNKPVLQEIVSRRAQFITQAVEAGFTTNALFLTEKVFDSWSRNIPESLTTWPANPSAQFLFGKFIATNHAGLTVLALVTPASRAAALDLYHAWPADLKSQQIHLSGWGLLGDVIAGEARRELPWLLGPIVLLVIATLWIAYGDFRLVLLSAACLELAALILIGTMPLLGWKWNLLNLAGLPLLLGMGVDFMIHIQLGLLRDGDLLKVRQTIGRALLLAGTTTVAAFGSLAFSSNQGMASLGQVCALGIAITLAVAIWILPAFWAWLKRGERP